MGVLKEKAGRYLGYTQGGGKDQLPTLYFEHGRLTQEHNIEENIGWHQNSDSHIMANVQYNDSIDPPWRIEYISPANPDDEVKNKVEEKLTSKFLTPAKTKKGERKRKVSLSKIKKGNPFLFEVSPIATHHSRGKLIMPGDADFKEEYGEEYALRQLETASVAEYDINMYRKVVQKYKPEIEKYKLKIKECKSKVKEYSETIKWTEGGMKEMEENEYRKTEKTLKRYEKKLKRYEKKLKQYEDIVEPRENLLGQIERLKIDLGAEERVKEEGKKIVEAAGEKLGEGWEMTILEGLLENDLSELLDELENWLQKEAPFTPLTITPLDPLEIDNNIAHEDNRRKSNSNRTAQRGNL